MASTFKAPLAAAILQGAERGLWSMADPLSFGREDLVAYAPVIEAHLEAGHLSLDSLCGAIVEVSDNAAANLLLAKIGGPLALTTFFRNSGDTISRLDRIEPDSLSPREALEALYRLKKLASER